jgi:hypothetical protein
MGYLSNSWAIFVNVPVATSHELCNGVARSAVAMASIAGVEVTAGIAGEGNRAVPSNPDSPRFCENLILFNSSSVARERNTHHE